MFSWTELLPWRDLAASYFLRNEITEFPWLGVILVFSFPGVFILSYKLIPAQFLSEMFFQAHFLLAAFLTLLLLSVCSLGAFLLSASLLRDLHILISLDDSQLLELHFAGQFSFTSIRSIESVLKSNID